MTGGDLWWMLFCILLHGVSWVILVLTRCAVRAFASLAACVGAVLGVTLSLGLGRDLSASVRASVTVVAIGWSAMEIALRFVQWRRRVAARRLRALDTLGGVLT